MEIELPPNDRVENYSLVKLEGKNGRRELEISALSEATCKINAQPLGGTRFNIITTDPLKPGEYILMRLNSGDATRGRYAWGFDFTVE
jgi:hypothetical protein